MEYAPQYMVPCDHWLGAFDRECGEVPTKRFLPGHRCQGHQPSRLAGHPDPPKPTPQSVPKSPAPLGASGLMDQRAIASGKKRAPTNAYLAAKAAVGRGKPKKSD